MRVPFGRLMEFVQDLSEADREKTLGELARQIGEKDAGRLADAITAVQVMRGKRTYIGVCGIECGCTADTSCENP